MMILAKNSKEYGRLLLVLNLNSLDSKYSVAHDRTSIPKGFVEFVRIIDQ